VSQFRPSKVVKLVSRIWRFRLSTSFIAFRENLSTSIDVYEMQALTMLVQNVQVWKEELQYVYIGEAAIPEEYES
jgi:hypothetical protein